MRKISLTKGIAAVSLPLLLLIPLAPFVSASPPVTGSGTSTSTVVAGVPRTAGGNTLREDTGTSVDSGDFVGTVTWTSHIALHADGSYSYNIKGTATGSLPGSSSGTCTYSDEGQGIGADFHGTFVLVQCDGGLTGKNIQGSYTGTFISLTTSVASSTFKVTS